MSGKQPRQAPMELRPHHGYYASVRAHTGIAGLPDAIQVQSNWLNIQYIRNEDAGGASGRCAGGRKPT